VRSASLALLLSAISLRAFAQTSSAPAVESASLTAAELAALGLGESAGVDTSLQLSGFADFSAYVPIISKGLEKVNVPAYESFYIGNLNLYLSKNLSESFRTMGEVRFSYLPNGNTSRSGAALDYESTGVADYADNARTIRWGSIMIQRMYLEWTLHSLLTVRAGQYLTPYGIWNVDHGSPTYIPVRRPYAIGNGWFPEHQTGFELFGRWNASGSSTVGYHLTLSNGAGAISDYRDLDANKAIGGRLYWEHVGFGLLRAGVSGYYGRDTSAQPSIIIRSNGSVDVGQRVTVQYDSLSIAGDVLFTYKGLHVQAEVVTQQRRVTSKGRMIHDIPLGSIPRGFPADTISWAGYGLLGYRLPWFALMPYVMLQRDNEVLLASDSQLDLVMFQGGLNLHPIDAVTFKVEYGHRVFLDSGPLFEHPYTSLTFQAAWAF
jgi:hypothetical protein